MTCRCWRRTKQPGIKRVRLQYWPRTTFMHHVHLLLLSFLAVFNFFCFLFKEQEPNNKARTNLNSPVQEITLIKWVVEVAVVAAATRACSILLVCCLIRAATRCCQPPEKNTREEKTDVPFDQSETVCFIIFYLWGVNVGRHFFQKLCIVSLYRPRS